MILNTNLNAFLISLFLKAANFRGQNQWCINDDAFMNLRDCLLFAPILITMQYHWRNYDFFCCTSMSASGRLKWNWQSVCSRLEMVLNLTKWWGQILQKFLGKSCTLPGQNFEANDVCHFFPGEKANMLKVMKICSTCNTITENEHLYHIHSTALSGKLKWQKNIQSILRLLRERPHPGLQNEPPLDSLDPQSPNPFMVSPSPDPIQRLAIKGFRDWGSRLSSGGSFWSPGWGRSRSSPKSTGYFFAISISQKVQWANKVDL